VEAKQQRERAILDAARDLATARTVREVTLTDVAAAVGMHKSAMLRYFETREQIFLALTEEGWVEWSAWLREHLTAPAGGEAFAVQSFGEIPTPAAVIARSLTARPLFCDLLAQAPMNLERNVSLESAYQFKISTLEQVGMITRHLAAVLGLPEQQARDLIATATSMAGAFWQMSATPGSRLQQLYESHPDLAHANVEVEPRLTRILDALIAGMREAQSPSPS
jgi:AcrR family transcriptional regulator